LKTIIEPFRIKVVEPIRLTTVEERRELLHKAGRNLFGIHSDDVIIDLLLIALAVGAFAARGRGRR
jgi:tryptophanase